ncbi:bifunctional folylpolyglutamate synthase/dihydrofolate synthase [Verrucomicrobium spinosum]|uniref:bifunctional folylpolyglutamate synthase/dihydrofolate synthase n=1 Tax=Verrucomicrobium spinosum TaxID=2736 RepID=UPI0001745D4D|nr:folylpolyglutamate synthase/dihydrofolate synthase family protein [Verrucomicrobium spinosum]
MLQQAQQERLALDWLYGTQLFGIKLGLENTRKLLDDMKLPMGGQKFLHVAGTNGKGSVCAFLHSLLKAAEVNAGLFTSPHLIHFRERIRDAERTITSQEIVKEVDALRKRVEGWDPHPTFFELTFALALDWFRKQELEWVVLETGMGGRLDATNTVLPAACVITSISLDHQQHLGATLREIATEKAGIIKPGVPVITLKQAPEVMQVLSDTARERGAPLSIVTTPLRGYQLGLFGQHQLWNATLAVAAFKAAGFRASEPVLRVGLKTVEWPARFQREEQDRLIIDGAHNPDAAETLVRTWHQAFPGEKASVVFGAVSNKDAKAVMRSLQPIASHWHFTRFDSPRAMAPEDLRKELADLYASAVNCSVHETIEDALAKARHNAERVLVTGSLYLAGEVISILRGEREWFQSSTQ